MSAEIEHAVIGPMYVGCNTGREFTTDDNVTAIKQQVPLSVSARETIEQLRNSLREGRAQPWPFQEVGDAE